MRGAPLPAAAWLAHVCSVEGDSCNCAVLGSASLLCKRRTLPLCVCRRLCAAAFADRQLQRSGRCHESEVFAAFRRAPGNGRYRSPDTLPDSTLRDMVRNWHPGVERTRTGYLKNMSLQGSSSAAGVAGARGGRVGVAAVVESEPPSPASSGSDLLDSIAAAAADQEVAAAGEQQQRQQ